MNGSPVSDKPIVHQQAYRVLTALVMVNLVVLAVFFIYPRVRFMAAHPGASHEEVLASSGISFARNFNNVRYLIPVFQLKDRTEPDATLIFTNDFPPGYIHRYLHPRSIYFAYETVDIERRVMESQGRPVYVIGQVPNFAWDYLGSLKYHDLSGGWRMAPVDRSG